MFKSYLDNSFQLVRASEKLSDLLMVKQGTPGIRSWTFTFHSIGYINDFPNYIPYKSVLYADDNTLLISAKTLDVLVGQNSRMLNQSKSWLKANPLHLDEKKLRTNVYYKCSK